MNELNNIVKQFTYLQHGESWIGINFKTAFQSIQAELAAKQLAAGTNSIWQLANHLIYWRTTVINRLNGSTDRPPFADFLLPDVLDEVHWKQTLHDFEAVYHQLRSTILHFNAEHLHRSSVHADQTNFELMVGCLQHDAYHLGQVILLKKGFT